MGSVKRLCYNEKKCKGKELSLLAPPQAPLDERGESSDKVEGDERSGHELGFRGMKMS